MADSRDTPPTRDARARPGPGRDEALRRRAAALRENLKRRKAQARGRKAGAAASDPEGNDGESA